MAPGELLEPDLTDHAEFVGTDHRLSADECAEIQTREALCASWAERRVRDVAGRIPDGTKRTVAGQSPNLGTAERWTQRQGIPRVRVLPDMWAVADGRPGAGPLKSDDPPAPGRLGPRRDLLRPTRVMNSPGRQRVPLPRVVRFPTCGAP